jgi:hypothetical protein
MSRDWMIDVLADLRSFAGANTMPGLAECLDDAILVAAAEIRVDGASADMTITNAHKNGSVHRAHQDNEYA